MKERWRWVRKYRGRYKVSTHGRVKSVGRWVRTAGGVRWVRPRILKPYITYNGYWCVGLSKHSRRKGYSIARLVAFAFIPNNNHLPEVNHKDGNKSNNAVGNLEWQTTAGNHAHAKRHNLKAHGEQCGASLLTEKEVVFIITQLLKGIRPKAVWRDRFEGCIDYTTVHSIAKRKTWNRVWSKILRQRAGIISQVLDGRDGANDLDVLEQVTELLMKGGKK